MLLVMMEVVRGDQEGRSGGGSVRGDGSGGYGKIGNRSWEFAARVSLWPSHLIPDIQTSGQIHCKKE